MSGPRVWSLPRTVTVPLHVLQRIGDLACVIRRRSTGEAAEAAAKIEKLVDAHTDHDTLQLQEIAEHGT